MIDVAPDSPTAEAMPSGKYSTWRRRDIVARISLVVLAITAVLAILAPVLPLPDPVKIDTGSRLLSPFSPGHILGTDEFGRDMLSRLVWGARISLLAGLGATVLSVLLGVPLGLVAGYYGRWLDEAISRFLDIVLAFPFILLAIAIATILGPGLVNAMIAVSIAGFPLMARVVRGVVLSVREEEFVSAAKAMGARQTRVLLRHVLPATMSPIIVIGTLDLGNKIIATASLSFLGLGVQLPTPDWGNMLASGRQYLTVAPHVALLPGIAIFLVVMSLNLLGDSLREGLDPRLRNRVGGSRG